MGSTFDSQSNSTGKATPSIARHSGRYLVATYWLWARHDRRIRTGELSDRLSVKPASVTEMFGKLDQASFVDYEKRRGVMLTEDGKQLARALAWRQCIVRTFFAEHVGIELTADDAYRIGYILSGRGLNRLRELVDHPCETACQETGTASKHCLLSA